MSCPLYPFLVLDLPEQTTDAAVEARYQALLRRAPPDREPERFQIIRAAYEALRTERDRIDTLLFYRPPPIAEVEAAWRIWHAGRPTLSPTQVAALIRGET